jgi:uncharacterized protein (DUF1697 family)
MRYAAFLRGINVGGRRPVKMDGVRAAFAEMGFQNARTIQASGNVLFDAPDQDDAPGLQALEEQIAAGLTQAFGYRMSVMVRRLADLETLIAADPFAGVPVTSETRLYVSFLSAPSAAPTVPADERTALVQVTEGEALTAIALAPGWGTTEMMAWLAKAFGPDITTRNWNTILKIIEA